MNRPGILASVSIAAMWGGGLMIAAPAAAAGSPPDLAGIWVLDSTLAPIPAPRRPGPDGLPRQWRSLGGFAAGGATAPPLRPEAVALIAREETLELAGRKWDDRARKCKPASVFDLMTGGGRLDIFQRWNEVTIIAEAERALPRHIYIDHAQASLEDVDINVMGHSVAKWDGATLVADTIAIEPGAYFMSADYIPQSDQTHVVERFNRQDDSTLAVDVTVTDPKVLAAPWTFRVVYHKQKPGQPFLELACDRAERMRLVQP